MAGWDGASLSDVLAPQPAVVRQNRARDAPGEYSPRTAAALGWQAPGPPRNRAQAAHAELWGGDLGAVLGSVRRRPELPRHREGHSHDPSACQTDAPSSAPAPARPDRGARQEWAGDLGALLASATAHPRGPRARPAYAAREQTSTGVMAALNPESDDPQRDRDRQRHLRPDSAQRLVDRHGYAEDSHGSGRAGGGTAAGRSGGGGGGGGSEGACVSAAVCAGDGQAHLGDMQLSPVHTDALPSAQARQGPRLSAASVRASQLRGAHSQKCSL
jgi:hypothetical protein